MSCETLVVFSHGKESGPWGSKIRGMADVAQRLDCQILSVNFRENPVGVVHDQDEPGEADRRVAQLIATTLPAHRKLILVGSSMGGYVSTVASQQLKPAALFLLAPAFYLPGYSEQDPWPHASALIVHGWGDSVVPVNNSIKFARKHRCDLHILNGDHRLNETLSTISFLFEGFLRRS